MPRTTPSSEPPRPPVRRRRVVDHVILFVDDLEVSMAFYSNVLGFEPRFSEHGYAEFVTEGTKFGLYERGRLPGLIGAEAAAAEPHAEVLFLVEDVDREAERLRASGAPVLFGPVDRPWGQRTLHVRGPAGEVIELAQAIPRVRPRGAEDVGDG